MYVSAVINPTGSLEKNTLADARELTHLKDPFGSLLKSLQSEGKSHISWSEIKPWIGEKAGLFITRVGGSGSPQDLLEHGLSNLHGSVDEKETQGALILDVKDASKARAFLTSQAKKTGSHTSSYKGFSYQIDSENNALGLVDHFAVIGSQAGFKQAIDTVTGGSSLAQAASYTELTSHAQKGSLVNLYLVPARLFDAVRTQNSQDAKGLQLLRKLTSSKDQLYVSLVPSSNSITIDSYTLSSKPSSSGGSAQAGAQMLAGMPKSSWLALGIGDLGERALSSLEGLKSLSSLGGSEVGELLSPLNSRSLNLKHDFLSWMGSAGLFISGSNVLNLQGALVITSKDQALSRAAVAKVAGLVKSSGGTASTISIPGTEAAATLKFKGSPLVFDLAAGQGKFILGLGEASITQALSPSGKLEGSSVYGNAVNALGASMKPSLILDFPALLGLLEGIGVQSDPSFTKALPYLRSLGTLTAGSERSGNLETGRLILALQ